MTTLNEMILWDIERQAQYGYPLPPVFELFDARCRVIGPYSDGTSDVEVYVDGNHIGTKTLPNVQNIAEQMSDFVSRCIAHVEHIDLGASALIVE